MPRLPQRLPLALLWFFVLRAGPLQAQPQAPPEVTGTAASAARAEAKRHFAKAVTLYNDDDFDAALAEFEAAYQSHPTPALLYNIGLTQKVLFRYVEAIATLSRYLAEAREEPVERVAEVRQILADMKSLLAEITLTVSPAETSISIDGHLVGTAPLPPFQLSAGHHLLELHAEDYQPQHKALIIVAGKPLALNFELQPLVKTGTAHIVPTPRHARISIDGTRAPAGTTDFELAAGGHTLEVAASGYHPQHSELAIAAGQVRHMTIHLEPLPRPKRIYQRWWFWTLVAAGIGGITTAHAVPLGARVEDPIRGTLPLGNQRP